MNHSYAPPITKRIHIIFFFLLTIPTISFSQGVGINQSTPDKMLDVGDGSGNAQIRLTYTDGMVYTDLQTTAMGKFIITPSGGNVGIGVADPNDMLDISGTINVFHVKSTGLSNSAAAQAPYFEAEVGEVTLFLGTGASTSGFTADQSGANIRFAGKDVEWGDLGYYPTGGDDGENGHFRFSTSASAINTAPDAKVGVGQLYAITSIGIGITTPARSLHVSDVMRLEPRASAPSSPAAGDLYYDSTLNKLRVYDGTTWQDCW